jgi:hypothetical protein
MAFFAILFEGFTASLASYPDDLISISAVTLPPIAGEAMIVDSALLQNKRHCRCGGGRYTKYLEMALVSAWAVVRQLLSLQKRYYGIERLSLTPETAQASTWKLI